LQAASAVSAINMTRVFIRQLSGARQCAPSGLDLGQTAQALVP
jgi:hypothetical protein